MIRVRFFDTLAVRDPSRPSLREESVMMPAVPRVGDSVTKDDDCWTVESVVWVAPPGGGSCDVGVHMRRQR